MRCPWSRSPAGGLELPLPRVAAPGARQGHQRLGHHLKTSIRRCEAGPEDPPRGVLSEILMIFVPILRDSGSWRFSFFCAGKLFE